MARITGNFLGGVLGPCYTEENIQYKVQMEGYESSLNPDSEGKTTLDTPEECIKFCKKTYGQKAQGGNSIDFFWLELLTA